MTRYIEKHPLATVMVVAIVLRLVAVVYSRGFMASDDLFQTVTVAYHWLHHGIWRPDGFLSWKETGQVSRFPLYVLSLYLNMKLMLAMGYDALDKIMYGVRLSHALFSLIGVWAVYRTVELVTGSKRWAMVGGLIMAAHFALPYLAVRNLIEMVGGIIWAVVFYCFARHDKDEHPLWLVLAGVISGLAWMVRFQLLFAICAVPVILWFDSRRIKPALYYGVTVLVMFLIAGIVDLKLTGTFMGTSLVHVSLGAQGGPTYATHFLIYVAVILGYFIPPFSPIAFYLIARKRFFVRYKLIVFSSLSFILIHAVIPYRQERYMIPIIPVLVIMIVLALHQHYVERGFFFSNKRLRNGVLGFAIGLNLILLVPLTVHYGHKGIVEPLAEIERLSNTKPTVLFVTPNAYRCFPFVYGGFDTINRGYIYDWSDLDVAFPEDMGNIYDYFLLYPTKREDVSLYSDSISSRIGAIEEAFHVEPSLVDKVLHAMNPNHNLTNEVWVYRPVGR